MSERWRSIRIASTWLRMQGEEREAMQRLEAAAGEGSEHDIPHQRMTKQELRA